MACGNIFLVKFINNFTELDQENIKEFLLHCEKKHISSQSRNLFLNAIKFYYRYVVKNSQKIEIQSAKKPKSLSTVLSRVVVNRILKSPKNAKHKLLLSLAYGVGLRVSEVIALKVQDLDFEELTVHIKQAKGQKDRISVMPESLIDRKMPLFIHLGTLSLHIYWKMELMCDMCRSC